MNPNDMNFAAKNQQPMQSIGSAMDTLSNQPNQNQQQPKNEEYLHGLEEENKALKGQIELNQQMEALKNQSVYRQAKLSLMTEQNKTVETIAKQLHSISQQIYDINAIMLKSKVITQQTQQPKTEIQEDEEIDKILKKEEEASKSP